MDCQISTNIEIYPRASQEPGAAAPSGTQGIPFHPRITPLPETSTAVYEDGRVEGLVRGSSGCGGLSLVIHEWRIHLPGRGHTTQAMAWLREQGYRTIVVQNAGVMEEGGPDNSLGYWIEILKNGLVDFVFDDNGRMVQPQISAAKPPRP